MRKSIAAALFATLACLPIACGSGTTSGGGTTGGADPGCDACSTTEVCVTNVSMDSSTDRCVAIPAACGKTAACGVQACISALYGLCEMGWSGVGCSDMLPPTIVSCNASK